MFRIFIIRHAGETQAELPQLQFAYNIQQSR